MGRLTRQHPKFNGPDGLGVDKGSSSSLAPSLSRFGSKSITKSKELLSMSPTLLRHTHSAQIFEYATFGRCSSARTIAHALIKEYAQKNLSASEPARRGARAKKKKRHGSPEHFKEKKEMLVTEGLGLGNDPLDRDYPSQLPRRTRSRRNKRAKSRREDIRGIPGGPYQVVFPNDSRPVSPDR